jgi:hypothetical protein
LNGAYMEVRVYPRSPFATGETPEEGPSNDLR